jgi:hypothetical protein
MFKMSKYLLLPFINACMCFLKILKKSFVNKKKKTVTFMNKKLTCKPSHTD